MARAMQEPEFVAEGPDGLRTLLDNFLLKAQTDQQFATASHYILYKLPNSELQSLIKVDMSQRPYQFWHYNLQERAALQSLKDTITNFLEKCGVSNAANCFHDVYEKLRQAKIAASMSGEVMPLPENPLQHGFALLAQEKRPVVEVPVLPAAKEAVGGGWFSFFSRKPEKIDEKLNIAAEREHSHKNLPKG
jgi:hypothetical protein